MEPTPELIRELYREDIEQARSMTFEQRLSAGGELFDYACQISMGGIRSQFPGISDADAIRELQRRLDIAQRFETRMPLP